MSAPELRVPPSKPAWFGLFGGAAAVPFVRYNVTVAGLLPEDTQDSAFDNGISGTLESTVALLPIGRAAHHSPPLSPQHMHGSQGGSLVPPYTRGCIFLSLSSST